MSRRGVRSRSTEPGAGVNREAGRDQSICRVHNAADPGVATPLRSWRIMPSRPQEVARAQKRGICPFSRWVCLTHSYSKFDNKSYRGPKSMKPILNESRHIDLSTCMINLKIDK
ncbi:hypothetical protein Taro_045911, partial [Colocasia esculenta]|nr:hypothetical protein [Colocasia esculenta]